MPDAIPLANPQCPLCGQPNQCVPASTGSFASSCWCKTATFPAELLTQVKPAERNKSCICERCANHFHTQFSQQ